MIFDRIELKDNDYGTVKKSSKVRKIKFKSISNQTINRGQSSLKKITLRILIPKPSFENEKILKFRKQL